MVWFRQTKSTNDLPFGCSEREQQYNSSKGSLYLDICFGLLLLTGLGGWTVCPPLTINKVTAHKKAQPMATTELVVFALCKKKRVKVEVDSLVSSTKRYSTSFT